ncbi:MAG: lysophospholipid acyltransferase family protein [Micropepsaceae bacterium]
MGLLKSIGRSRPVRWLATFLAAGYIRTVRATSRWEVVNAKGPQAYWDEGKPFILAFWHGRILMMPYCWPKDRRMNMLISRHRDGGLIADTIGWFGLDTVRGSTAKPGRERDKGATAALMEMLRKLKSGEYVGITPDGPRGPRMRATDGVAAVARLAGVPVFACAWSTRRRRLLSSWDRFVVALPFTKGVFVWGEPITVPAGAKGEALEAARLAIETELTRVTREADRLIGHDPDAILPADPAPAEAEAAA